MNVVIALLIMILVAAILIPVLGLRRKSEVKRNIRKQSDEGVLMV